MADVLSPVPKLAFLNNDGKPLVGGKLFTYSAGTSTKLATYVNSAGVTPNTNPVILDYRGEANVWIPPNVPYKYVLANPNDTDPPGNPIWSVDNVVSSQLITLYGGVDTGSVNAYVLNFTANFTSYVDGTVIYWIPSSTNTAASTINVNGLGPVLLLQQNGSVLRAGQIQANEYVQMVYRSGAFNVIGPLAGSFLGTMTGVTGTVTGTINWYKNGIFVTLLVPGTILGTSNSVDCTITGLPASLWPVSVSSVSDVPFFANNSITVGTVVASVGFTGVITFGNSQVSGGFTAAGTKGTVYGFQITYLLV